MSAKSYRRFVLAAFISLVVPCMPAGAAPGDLDPSFGSGGQLVTDFFGLDDAAGAAVIQPDGKLVVAGFARAFRSGEFNVNTDFALVRYRRDGSLDLAFGRGGRVTTDFGANDRATAVTIQPDGKFVVAGISSCEDARTCPTVHSGFALARYDSDGSLDPTFGNAGKVTSRFFGNRVEGVALQPDGKIVVVGLVVTDLAGEDFALARYNSDGSLDLSFGNGGRATTDFGSGEDEARAIAIQPDGRLVVAGGSSSGRFPFDSHFALARYNSDGLLDMTFGDDGKVVTPFMGPGEGVRAIALRPDGRIIAVGSAGGGDSQAFAVARYKVDGTLDESFGSGGTVTSKFPGGASAAVAVAVQRDGKVVVAGSALTGNEFEVADFALARYTPDGTLDPTFGNDGTVTSDFPASFCGDSSAAAVAIDADGRVVAAGGMSLSCFDDANVAVVRYRSDGSVDAILGGGMVTTIFPSASSSGAASMAVQPDGKLVVGGSAQTIFEHFALARYNADGSLDSTFGSGGAVITGNVTDPDFLTAITSVAVQGDGKIVVAGDGLAGNVDAFALARYNADGSLDPSFGAGGTVTTDFAGRRANPAALVLQPDGKVVVAGFVLTDEEVPHADFAVARYDPDGSLDISFGADGIVTTDFAGSDDFAAAVALLPDGELVVAGGTSRSGGGTDFALARYNRDGTLDRSFGTSGTVTTDFFHSDGSASGIVMQRDGKFIVVGSVRGDDGTGNFGVARYTAEGSLDGSFGIGGLVSTAFVGFGATARAVVLEPDGKIVVAGSATTAPGLDGIDFALVRYDTDGSLDPTFGTGGKVVTDFIAPCSGFCLPGETATALVVQGDGKLVAAGMTTARADEAFALARYEGGNASTTSTTSTTTTVTTTTRPRLMPEECGDGIDNDGDALVDCKDPDCETSPQCSLGCPVGPTPDAVRCRTMALARPVGDTTPTGKLRDRLLKLSGRIDTLQVGADSSCRAGKTFRARRALVVESHAIVTLRRRLGTLPLSDPEAESRRQLRKALRLLNQDVHGLTRALHCPSTRG